MINLNELLKQAYPNSTHGGKGLSASLLRSMGDVRFSRPMEDRHSLDEHMIPMLDDKGKPIVDKEKDVYLLGKSIEELLAGTDLTWYLAPAYLKKLNKIKQRLPKYHKPVFDMLQHEHTLHNPFIQADFMVETDAVHLTAKLCGEVDFLVMSSAVKQYLPGLLTQKEKHGQVLIELKSTSSMKYWFSEIDKRQYLIQLAIYKFLLEQAGMPVDEVFILFVDTANFGNIKFVSIPELGIGTDLIEAKLLQLHAALNATPVYKPDMYRLREEQGEQFDVEDYLSDVDFGKE